MSYLVSQIHFKTANLFEYWDNPNNCYHNWYQRVVTRVTLTAVISLIITLLWTTLGTKALLWLFINTIVLIVSGYLVGVVVAAILSAFVNWITGRTH